MQYTKAHIDAIGYELAPVVVSSDELEERLAPALEKLRIPSGQIEALTGVSERRWWPEGHQLSDGAAAAARRALAKSGVPASEIGAVLYTGVCRELFEPATACRVASTLGVRQDALVYDISNACLGVLNGILEVANRIELGQIRAGLVTSAETARSIVESTIDDLIESPRMEGFVQGLATMTGGSGAVAVVVTDGSFGSNARRLRGASVQSAPEHHSLCRWGLETARDHLVRPFMKTDAAAVLKHGLELGTRTWKAFLGEVRWASEDVDKVICHQVGSAHQQMILKELGIAPEKDFVTFPYLGNMGTVSLPITAAMAEERGFLTPGARVGFLGIGSGLNCMMLGLEW